MNSICTRLLATLRSLEKHRCKGNGDALIHLEPVAQTTVNLDKYIDPVTGELKISKLNI